MRIRIGLVAAALLALFVPAHAQPTTQPATTPAAKELPSVVVTSDLDVAREEIAPPLGAVTYQIGPDQIQNTPQGENAPFQQVLLRAPGVVEDSFGQEHVRGEHANLTYRVNGVILPEAISGFGQELDTRLIDSVTLIDGSLPAQFGFHTAGIVDVQTKSGAALDHNELSFYGGSFDTVQPSFQLGGTHGRWDYFITGSYTHNNLGIENPTPDSHAIHDVTNQGRNFDYFSYKIDDTSRFSILANASYGDFQIPQAPGQTPAFTLAGSGFSNSAKIDENQNEQNYYSVVSYQKSGRDLSFQASVFSRYGQIHFQPDTQGDLVFQGVAGEVLNNFLTNGVQIDGSYILNDSHTIRAGLIGDYTAESLNTNTYAFPGGFDPVSGSDFQTSSTPEYISDNSGNEAVTAGVYAQDEWHVNKALTINYGARFDTFNSNFDNENQLSPRVNFVYKVDEENTLHAGYARYFVTPPLQNISQDSVNKFIPTSNATGTTVADPTKVERSNYYDVGMSHQFSKEWLVNVDGFYKASRNLIDEGQFGSAVIETPFNYARGYVYGAEVSSTYKYDALSLFGNFSWVETRAKDINSQQFDIAPDELAYIQNHYIRLDHQGEFTASGGASYNITRDDLVYADVLYGSGLRSGFANDRKEPQYVPVNLGYQRTFHLNNSDKNLVKFRVDVTNVFDESYQLRSGSGIGVGAAQFGQRRGIFVGVDYDF
jgi:outer membrane receptor protein involved in Fe transport